MANDSLDYSFEFREAAKKSKMTTANQPKSQQTNGLAKKSQQSVSKSIARKASEKNLVRVDSETLEMSPFRASATTKKSSQMKKSLQESQNKERDSKRFKQLTMTQAFANHNDTSLSYKASNSNANKDLIYKLNIKDEPILVVNDFNTR